MLSRVMLARRLLASTALALLPVLAHAQPAPSSQGLNRNQLRDRIPGQKAPDKAKLDESLRKFREPDRASRLEGVRMLGTVEDEQKAAAYLLEAVNDSDTAVRLAAIDTLGQMRAKDAVAPLVQQLFMRGTDDITMQHIVVALGRIRDSRATKPLVDFLARDTTPQLRGSAVFALGEIGDDAALAPLGQLAEDTEDAPLRSVAQSAMRKIRDKPAPEVIPSALAQERLRARPPGGGSGAP